MLMVTVQDVNHISIILIVFVIKIQKAVPFNHQLTDAINAKMGTDLTLENVFKISQS
jgi:hypothetical protein